jgi:hypothetical protein
MPELAPIETKPPAGSCPTAEDLACYIDGTLSPEEAARVTEHLASCESCFEVYSEVVRFQLESAPAPKTGKVVPFPSEGRKRERLWYPIAALLILGLGFGIYSYLHLLAPPPTLVTAELTAPLQGRAGLADHLWRPATRGGGEGEEKDWRLGEVAFRLGVQAINLRASLEAGDRDTAADVIAYILNALKDQPLSGDLEQPFKELKSTVLEGGSPSQSLGEADRLLQDARELDPLFFDLGRWVAGGQLAASYRDPAFFRLPESRDFLRRSLWRDRLGLKDSKLPQGSRNDLDAIYQLLAKGDLQPADYATLKSHFDNILTANYPD